MIKRKNGFMGERALVLPNSILNDMEKDAIASQLYITDMGYYPHASHHFRERLIAIPQFVFIYCVEGKGWYKVKNNHYSIEKNQCFILPANVPHSYGADEVDPWTIYWVHFKGKIAEPYAQQLYTPMEIKLTTQSRIEYRIELFEEIYHILEMGYSKENLLYACSAFHHFMGTIAYLYAYRNAEDSRNSDDIVDAAIHFMRESLDKKLSVEEIAQHIGYSSSHFSSLFNKRTGCSPLNYFNRLKIQHACNLLDFSDMKINQVCYKIGIDDCYYFSRLFNKIMGMSPRTYKNKIKG